MFPSIDDLIAERQERQRQIQERQAEEEEENEEEENDDEEEEEEEEQNDEEHEEESDRSLATLDKGELCGPHNIGSHSSQAETTSFSGPNRQSTARRRRRSLVGSHSNNLTAHASSRDMGEISRRSSMSVFSSFVQMNKESNFSISDRGQGESFDDYYARFTSLSRYSPHRGRAMMKGVWMTERNLKGFQKSRNFNNNNAGDSAT
ncbi:hypothetical protein K1719_036971 [Acacia pycnantha]|nr:hypothetical protein K1719_036971 [Acacia pycnantha]